jgi:hypothetical protein
MSRQLSVRDLCDITGKGDKTIKAKLADLVPSPGPKGAKLYPSDQALALIYTSAGDLNTERAHLTKVQREIAEKKLDVLNGKLFSIDDIAKEVRKNYATIRAQFRSIPSSLAKPLSMVNDPAEIHTRLDSAINEVLAELSADTKYETQRLNQHVGPTEGSAGKLAAAGLEAVTTPEPSGVGGRSQTTESGEQLDTGPLED